MKFLYYFSPFYRGKSLATYYHENESPGLLMKAIMRIHIIFFLILVTCLNVFSKEATAQISLHIERGDLETVFKAIERQTDYSFMYEVSLLKGSKVVSIDVKGARLKEVLDEVFRDQPFYYEVISKTIVVKERTSSQPGQERKEIIPIRGKVTDIKGNALIGVSVRIKGANSGTMTDKGGNYSIEAEPNGVIIFSFVGYQTFNIMINGQTEINMTMIENIASLQETVVKGYYSTTKELNTGNVSTVSAVDLARQPISDPIVALQGRVPGLFIQQTSGVIGRDIVVRLRGQNSLGNGNDPLYIVDGIPFISETLTLSGSITGATGRNTSPFSNLNINDIEKIEILKDADATAIYGSRGANGVILITTKKGSSENDKLDVNAYSGIGQIGRRLDLLNLGEYLDMRKQAFLNDNAQPSPTRDHDLNGTWDQSKYTDWQDKLIGGTARVNDLQASLSGGNSNTHYRIGGTYRKETTVYPGDFYGRKAGVLFNFNHQSKDKKLYVNFSANYISNFNNLPINDFTNNITLAPNAPDIYNTDGTLNWANNTWVNPFAPLFTETKESTENLISNFQVGYKIIPGLEVKSNFGYNKLDFQQNNITPFSSLNPAIYIDPSTSRLNEVATNKSRSWIIEPQLSYNKYFWKGDFNILIGSTLLQSDKTTFGEIFTGFSNDALIENIAAALYRTVRTNSNKKYKYKYNALFARVGYTIDEKYILNLTARRDGSSRFGPGKQFGNFGAIGGAWIFSKEKLLKKMNDILSFGKIRVSYGTTGNDQIGDYAYLSTYTPYTPAYQGVSSLEPTQHTNPLYGWERVNKLEGALELGFFKDRLLMNASYYRNRTNNQLVSYALPIITGFNFVRANLPAVLQNSGVEIEVFGNIIKRKAISWTANLNITFPKNKLISYPNIENSSYSRRYAVGQPLSLSYLYSYIGLDPQTNLYGFKDINGDGRITSAFDREFYFIGQKYFGGIQNNIEYKRLQLNFLFQFTKQNGLDFNQSFSAGLFNNGNGNVPTSALNGDKQPISQMTSGTKRTSQNLFFSSSGTITDASFLRLSNLALSWEVPPFQNQSKSIPKFRLYAQCQNLLTITNYKGSDPELGRSATYVLPPLRMLTAGLQMIL